MVEKVRTYDPKICGAIDFEFGIYNTPVLTRKYRGGPNLDHKYQFTACDQHKGKRRELEKNAPGGKRAEIHF